MTGSARYHRGAFRTSSWVLVFAVVCAWALGTRPVAAQDTLRIVKSFHTIDPVAAYFKSATIPDSAQFGPDVACLGDIDRDGVPDLALAMNKDTLGTQIRGSVTVLFMNSDGTVKSYKRISSHTDSLDVQLDIGDRFGIRLANIGDLNDDGMVDMAVLAAGDDDGGTDHGAVYILFLDTAATVIGYQKISDTEGGFLGTMTNGNFINSTVAEVGDMNGDGIQDIAVGATTSDDGGSAGSARGAFWILLMNRDGTVNGFRHYSALSTWPGGNPLTSGANFGFGIAKLGDLDGDGYNDIAVSARLQGYMSTGRIYILFFNSTGGIKAYQAIGRNSSTSNLGGLKFMVNGTGGHFGWSMDNVGDLNGDGTTDLAIGASQQSDGYAQAGAVLIAYLKPNGTIQYEDLISNSAGTGPTSLNLHATAWFGNGVAAMGDFDGDHVMDLAVTARNYDPGGYPWRGRLFILKLNAKPLRVASTTQDATGTTAGKVKLDIKGGIRPYRLVWMDTIPTITKLNTWKASIDTSGFASIGMPQALPNTLTVEQLIALHQLDTAAISTGAYPLVVADAVDSVRYCTIHIGRQLVQGSRTGANLGFGKDLTKTGASGWTTMRFTSKNRLPAGQNGWVRFIAPNTTQRIAIGLSKENIAQVGGYQQMAYAFHLSSDSIWCWDSGSLHLINRKFKADDQFRIEQRADSVCYYHERTLVRTVTSVPMNVTYMTDCAADQNGAQIKQVTMSFPSSFHVGAGIDHLAALDPGSGAIDLSIIPNTGTYTYDWLDGPATTQDRSSLPQGRYEVDIASSYFGHTRRFAYEVGSELLWQQPPSALADTAIGLGYAIHRTSSGPSWTAARSENLAGDAQDHWTAFRAHAHNGRGALVGWRSKQDNDLWAAWWVHPFGNDLLAQAVGDDGVIASAVITDSDELRILGHGPDSVQFLLNGQPIAADARTSDLQFQLIAALRTPNDRMTDLATSVPVPLRLDTRQFIPGIPYSFSTPDPLVRNATTGTTTPIDLRFGPRSGDHLLEIAATDSTDAITFLFQLLDGEVSDLRLLVNDTTYQVDSSAYILHPPNELAFLFGADEAPDTSAAAEPPYLIDLQDGLFLTPNGDSEHDLLQVLVNTPLTSFEFTVLDRADNILFHTTDPGASWNGRYMNSGDLQDDGIYRYLIQLDDLQDAGEFILKH